MGRSATALALGWAIRKALSGIVAGRPRHDLRSAAILINVKGAVQISMTDDADVSARLTGLGAPSRGAAWLCGADKAKPAASPPAKHPISVMMCF